MQIFATFVKNKCNFFNFLVQQKLALVLINATICRSADTVDTQ